MKLSDLSQFCCKAMLSFIWICTSHLFLNVVWQRVAKLGKYMIDASAGKCVIVASCAWQCIFVGVKWESGTPVLHVSLIAPLRHCSPSLKHVFYPAPQSSVTAGGHNVRLRNDELTHHSVSRCVSFMARGCSQIWSRPHGCMTRLTSGLTDKMKLNVW